MLIVGVLQDLQLEVIKNKSTFVYLELSSIG